jgi:hypothetical protein
MCCCTSSNHPQQVPGSNGVSSCPTDPFLGSITKGINAARSHVAVAATDPQLAKTTLGLLFFKAVPDGLNSLTGGFPKQEQSRPINAPLCQSNFPLSLKNRSHHPQKSVVATLLTQLTKID